jgi:hypothetical protein
LVGPFPYSAAWGDCSDPVIAIAFPSLLPFLALLPLHSGSSFSTNPASDQLPEFASVAASYPDIQFVLPVMGWPIDLTNEGHETWKRALATASAKDLARIVPRSGRRVLINAQMSGFGGEAEILCSTRALPVLTPVLTTHHSSRPLRSRSSTCAILRGDFD